jgi:FixJ family two-component response regulator
LFGFNAFISKPCTDEDLLNTIKAVLEIKQGAQAHANRMPLQ